MELLVPSKPKPKSATDELKESVLQHYRQKEKLAIIRQRNYMKILTAKVHTRKENIVNSSCEAANGQLRREIDSLKRNIWVANGKEHHRLYERYLQQIYCHIKCQDRLSTKIREIKTSIENLEREISRVTKQVYDLNRQTVPDTQHQRHVAKARKQLQMLENRLEIGMRRECDFTAQNAALREELMLMLHDRTQFNDFYTKMVQKLNFEKRYLTDLIEYALGKFDNCIDVYEKIEFLRKRVRKEDEVNKMEMQFIIRTLESEWEMGAFAEVATKRRSLAELSPKEIERRKKFRLEHMKKITLYRDVLHKILKYTQSSNVGSVIKKFQEQEGRYYSYFTYVNEVGYHITLLNNAVNRLYIDLDVAKQINRNIVEDQVKAIKSLEETLEKKKAANEELKRTSDNNDTRIDKLMNGLQLILDQCRVQIAPQDQFLGNFDQVSLTNMRYYLRVIEQRVHEIVAATYIMERMNETKTFKDYIVHEIDKVCEPPTKLNSIVLTQQCPECAEDDVYNIDDVGEGAATVLSTTQIRKRIYDKVQQPEMQYRLHGVSECRLPRSRIIAANQLEMPSQVFG